MNEIFNIAQSQYSALIICMVGLFMFWQERKISEKKQADKENERDKERAEKDKRREDRQDRVNILLEEQIMDGISKSHEQHVQIINLCQRTNDNIDNKAKHLNQKIDLVMRLRNEKEDEK